MSERPPHLDYAGRPPPRPREPGLTLAEHGALSGVVATIGFAFLGSGVAILLAAWPFAAGIWAIVGCGGRSVPGWVGVAVGGGILCLLAFAVLTSRF